ncbi:MAG: folate-binding protein YgfZ [Candidatus Puniceispirillum sp.]|nr:folate-binding protein YgfZ [Candidatus Puniceispirillum sp.]MBL6775239.1 folate-binding protein YgfZ [Candidatus Puniceispirillum sp.]
MTPTPEDALICHPDTGFITVAGDEACAFLQSIITANVETLAVGACRPSALLTPQGRVLIDMMVYRLGESQFLLRSDAARRDDLFTRLRRYRLRRPIDLVVEPDIRLLLMPNEPTPDMDGVLGSINPIMACPDPRSPSLGTHCLVEGPNLPPESGRIDIWHTKRIAAAVPEGPVDLTPERALLLEAGLDQLGAVDFDKGCYVGQEVTARTHYRGLVKRRLVPLIVRGAPPPVNSEIMLHGTPIGNSKTAAPYNSTASAAPNLSGRSLTDLPSSICLALLKLSDLQTVLDNDANNGLTVNGEAAKLALPNWMLPLPRPAKA